MLSPKILKVGFLGSSTSEGFESYTQDLKQILEFLFSNYKQLLIINGGYKGLMEKIGLLAKTISDSNTDYKLNILGTLFDGYLLDPNNEKADYTINTPNSNNNIIISSGSIGERVHNLIELSDVVIALPGRSGTLHEILHCIEHIKYGMDYNRNNFNRLILHRYWSKERLTYLRDTGIISKEIHDRLNFWSNSSKQKEKLKGKLDSALAHDYRKKIAERKKEINEKIDKSDVLKLCLTNREVELPVPDEDSYMSLIRHLNKHFKGFYSDNSDKNYVIGIDVVILDIIDSKITSLITLGVANYIQALEKFLNSHSSILCNKEYLEENLGKFHVENLDNINPISTCNSLLHHSFSSEGLKIEGKDNCPKFDDWTKFLITEKIGKSVAWLTIPALDGRYYISCFTSFNAFIPELSKEELRNILSSFLYSRTLTTIHQRLNQEIISQAIKAGISQVMSRNLSHNIGSHVLIKVVSDEKSVTGANSRPLFDFIQKRMEFIANISGSIPSFQNTFYLFKDIISHYNKDIIGANGNKVDYRNLLKLFFDNISGNEKIKNDHISFSTKTETDYQVSVPNGYLGCQAFHIIVENIIRNSSKHNTAFPNITGKIQIQYTFDIKALDDFPDYYLITITDNFGELNKNLIFDFDAEIRKPIIVNGTLRQGGWGLLEMKICAAYLAGIPLEYIDKAHEPSNFEVNGVYESFPPVLKIERDTQGNLVHSFYLQKPKLAAVDYELKK